MVDHLDYPRLPDQSHYCQCSLEIAKVISNLPSCVMQLSRIIVALQW
jgi:hypothetical protein